MRLLMLGAEGEILLTEYFYENAPHYAVLSHTWGPDSEEVSFRDIETGQGRHKSGYHELLFCARQTRKDGLIYSWVDTCCIDKANNNELSEAITSMYKWYQDAVECYVYLADVPDKHEIVSKRREWETAFRRSRWFTRGWTLQELIAPRSVKFYSQNCQHIGSKQSLARLIHEITKLPFDALDGTSVDDYSVEQRLSWARGRKTKRKEDKAYCLLGLFGIFMPLIYGEGDNAFIRLREQIDKKIESIPRESSVQSRPTVDSRISDSERDPAFYLGDECLVERTEEEEEENFIAKMTIANCQNACFQFCTTHFLRNVRHIGKSGRPLFADASDRLPASYSDLSLQRWLIGLFYVLDNKLVASYAVDATETFTENADRDAMLKVMNLLEPWSEYFSSGQQLGLYFWNAYRVCRLFRDYGSAVRIKRLAIMLGKESFADHEVLKLLPRGPAPVGLQLQEWKGSLAKISVLGE